MAQQAWAAGVDGALEADTGGVGGEFGEGSAGPHGVKLLGACHYLAKPTNTDDIEAAFGLKAGDTGVDATNRFRSLKTLEWERIHEVLAKTGFNFSETARRLGMHRRTLARKLEKQQGS